MPTPTQFGPVIGRYRIRRENSLVYGGEHDSASASTYGLANQAIERLSKIADQAGVERQCVIQCYKALQAMPKSQRTLTAGTKRCRQVALSHLLRWLEATSGPASVLRDHTRACVILAQEILGDCLEAEPILALARQISAGQTAPGAVPVALTPQAAILAQEAQALPPGIWRSIDDCGRTDAPTDLALATVSRVLKLHHGAPPTIEQVENIYRNLAAILVE